MPVDVKTSVQIDRPPSQVAPYVSEPENAPRWYVNIRSAKWVSEPPLKKGSKLSFSASFLGRRLDYVYEVVEYVPEKLLVMRTADGPFVMETTYAFEPSSGGTRVSLRNRGNPRGFSRLIAPFMGVAMRRQNHKDLRRLKSVLEG